MTGAGCPSDFRDRLHAGPPLIGTWVKTPHRLVSELLAGTELDCLCLDEEHAPFDRSELDGSVFACRASAMPVLVRVRDASPTHILNALDLGATGVLVPHVRSGDEAEAAVRHSLFGPSGRGYAGSTRSAGFTRKTMADHRSESASRTVIVAQIEDADAVGRIDEICSVDRLDCLFIGRADLAVSLGCQSMSDPAVVDAVGAIVSTAIERQRTVGMFVSDMDEVPRWVEAGVRFFLLSSDQAFLLNGARRLRQSFDTLTEQTPAE